MAYHTLASTLESRREFNGPRLHHFRHCHFDHRYVGSASESAGAPYGRHHRDRNLLWAVNLRHPTERIERAALQNEFYSAPAESFRHVGRDRRALDRDNPFGAEEKAAAACCIGWRTGG